MRELIRRFIKQKVLKSPSLIEAFLANDRKNFVPREIAGNAYLDAPLPLFAGQTISQPTTVAFMMELLAPQKSQNILDIGFGSGWTTAILASIVGKEGKVFGLEIVPDLYEFGKINLEKMGYENIKLINKSGWDGLGIEAPFDRILVSAAAPEVPEALKEQLKVGGRMVIPVGFQYLCSLKVLDKIGKDKFEEKNYPGFAFVPLVK